MGKIRGPQVDAGTGADQLVQLDGSGNMPAIDGSAMTGVAVLSGANTFAGLQTITHTGDIGMVVQDTDGGDNSAIDFLPAGSQNFSARINNFNGSGTEQLAISKRTSGGAGASIMRLYADGEASIANSVNAAAMTISSAGAITINSASGQRITMSDESRFFTVATFTSHATVTGTAINWNVGNKVKCSVASGTLSFTNPPAPCSLVLVLTGGSGVFLPAAVKWPDGGAEPAKTGTSVIGLYFDGSTYYAMQSTNFV